jgi:cytoskeleton-associated protein 5
LEHGLKAKVAKTRQGTLDELSVILKKSGMGACESSKAFPQIAALISDKDPQVRKSALGTLRYSLFIHVRPYLTRRLFLVKPTP